MDGHMISCRLKLNSSFKTRLSDEVKTLTSVSKHRISMVNTRRSCQGKLITLQGDDLSTEFINNN